MVPNHVRGAPFISAMARKRQWAARRRRHLPHRRQGTSIVTMIGASCGNRSAKRYTGSLFPTHNAKMLACSVVSHFEAFSLSFRRPSSSMSCGLSQRPEASQWTCVRDFLTPPLESACAASCTTRLRWRTRRAGVTCAVIIKLAVPAGNHCTKRGRRPRPYQGSLRSSP